MVNSTINSSLHAAYDTQISCLDDNKSTAEANALKSLALDHLGVITAKLRSACVKAKQINQDATNPVLVQITQTWEEVVLLPSIEVPE